MYPGENTTADFTVDNLASVDIPLTIVAKVTAYPVGGAATDLTLGYPETFEAASGTSTLTINVTALTGAVPGDYTITLNVTRI